jgi:aspartate 1-decarboxylase
LGVVTGGWRCENASVENKGGNVAPAHWEMMTMTLPYRLFPAPALALGLFLSHPPLVHAESWQLVSPRPTAESLRTCLASNVAGKYLAAGASGALITSSDGNSWNAAATLPDGAPVFAMAEKGERLVAVGGLSMNAVLTSDDATTWTQHQTTSGTLTDVISDGSRFIATDLHSSGVRESGDGVDWTLHAVGSGLSLEGIAWNGTTYVVVGRNGVIHTSTDLATWTPRTSGVTTNLNSVAWGAGAGRFVAVGADGTLLSSTDGVTWSAHSIGGYYAFNRVHYATSLWQFVAVGEGMVRTSVNGIDWVDPLDEVAEQTTRSLRGVCSAMAGVVAVGDGGLVLVSGNGSDWAKKTPDHPNLRAIARGNGRYVAVGDLAGVLTSSDGVAWSPQYLQGGLSTSATLRGVVWAPELALFVAVGTGGWLYTSPDGVSWTFRSAGTTADFRSLAWDGTRLVASAYGGVMATSTDGVDWTTHTLPSASATSYRIHYLGGRFVTIGTSYYAYTSTNGLDWTMGAQSNMGVETSLGWDGIRYTTGKYASTDGLNWVEAATPLSFVAAITHDGERFIAAGSNGSLHTSSDGSTWQTQAAFTANNFNGLILDGTTAILVGDHGAVHFRSGIEVVESGGVTAVTEGGAGDSYTLVLAAPPLADVVVDLTPEAGIEVTPNPITFTGANWSTPQTVTVSATNDSLASGDRTRNIAHAVTSADPTYDGAAIADIAVSVTEDDIYGLLVTYPSGSSVTVTEGAGEQGVTLALAGAPSADVTVTVLPPVGVVTTDKGELTFTTANWSAPQNLAITAVDDRLVEETLLETIGFMLHSNDSNYNLGQVSEVVSVTVHDDDHAPTVDAGQNFSIAESSGGGTTAGTVVGTVSASDADGDAIASFAIMGGNIDDAFAISAGGVITVAGYLDFETLTGYTLNITAGDGVNTSIAQDVSIGVTDVVNENAPVAQAGSGSGDEDTTIVVILIASDADSDSLTYAIAAQPAHGVVQLSGATATYTPAADYSGADSFTFTANDGVRDSAPATVSLTVNPVNDAPVAQAGSGSGDEDTTIVVILNASDADSDSLTYAIAAQPAHGVVQLSGATATYTPEADYSGADSFTFTASDGVYTSAAATVSLTVNPVNDAPRLSGTPPTGAVEGVVYSFTATLTDIDTGDTHTWNVTGAPAWLTINATSGLLSGTPGRTDVGTSGAITVQVVDAAGAAGSLTPFVITVEGDPDHVSSTSGGGGPLDPLALPLLLVAALYRRWVYRQPGK